SIWLEETGDAVRLVGTAGGAPPQFTQALKEFVAKLLPAVQISVPASIMRNEVTGHEEEKQATAGSSALLMLRHALDTNGGNHRDVFEAIRAPAGATDKDWCDD